MWKRHVYMRAGSAAAAAAATATATGIADCNGDAAMLLHDDDEARDGVAAPLSRTLPLPLPLPSPAEPTDLVVITGDRSTCSKPRTRRWPGLDVVSTEEIDEGDDPPDKLGRVGEDEGISTIRTSRCFLRWGTGPGCIDGDDRWMSRAQSRQATTDSTRGLRKRTLRHAPPSAGVCLFAYSALESRQFRSRATRYRYQKHITRALSSRQERRVRLGDIQGLETFFFFFYSGSSLVRIHVNR